MGRAYNPLGLDTLTLDYLMNGSLP